MKANRDRRLNPTKEHLALNIFLLNVDAETLLSEDVVALYGLRWRIESIFKAWKSHFHLTHRPCGSVVQVKASLYAMFIVVTLFHTFIVAPSHALNSEQPTEATEQKNTHEVRLHKGG